MPWIDKCFIKIAGCGKIHKHTNIHNFYNVNYNKHFKKGWNDTKGLKILREKMFHVPLYLPQIRCGMVCDQTSAPKLETDEKQIFV